MESEIIFIRAQYYEAQRLTIKKDFFSVNECFICFSKQYSNVLLLLSRFSHVRLCATP